MASNLVNVNVTVSDLPDVQAILVATHKLLTHLDHCKSTRGELEFIFPRERSNIMACVTELQTAFDRLAKAQMTTQLVTKGACVEVTPEVKKPVWAISFPEVEESIIEEIRTRRDKGRAKYGVTMERTDLTPAQWAQHMKEELLDAAIYLEKLTRVLKPDPSNGA